MFDCQRVSMMTYHCLYWRCPFQKCLKTINLPCSLLFWPSNTSLPQEKHVVGGNTECFSAKNQSCVFLSAPQIPWIMWTFLSFILLFPLSGNSQKISKNGKSVNKDSRMVLRWCFPHLFHIFSSFPGGVFGISWGNHFQPLQEAHLHDDGAADSLSQGKDWFIVFFLQKKRYPLVI